jgi:hypothetical protein
MVDGLNIEFCLDGTKRLARSTVYPATKDRLAGCSPTKQKGPAPKTQNKFLDLVATHAEVCQVGDGMLKGKDLERLIGASILGTPHANAYKLSQFGKRHKGSFQMPFKQLQRLSSRTLVLNGRRMTISTSGLTMSRRTSWQLLVLLSTKTSSTLRTEHWCQRFGSKRTPRDDSLIWLRLTMTLASLATRVVLALSLITTQCSREEQQEESNQQGM